MSDLRPVGVPVEVKGVERHLLFTLNTIDEIQEHYDKTLDEVLDYLMDDRKLPKVMTYILCVLLNDEAERKPEDGLIKYTEKEIGNIVTREEIMEYTFKILKAYGVSIPEADAEVEAPN